jgi:uncharacterized protein (DUF4213/DUF364 family)
MSPEETMQFQSTESLDPSHEMLLRISSAKQFALGALVVAQNALVNTYIHDISSSEQLDQLQGVINFLKQSMVGAFDGVNDLIEEAKENNGVSVSKELDSIPT